MGIWIWHSWMVSGVHSALSNPAGSTAAEEKHWEHTAPHRFFVYLLSQAINQILVGGKLKIYSMTKCVL